MLRFISKKKADLTKKEILAICKLKNTEWKRSLNSQLEWFEKNIKNKDVHNCLYFKKALIGYTLLRLRRVLNLEKKKYFLLDTLIVKKEFRKKNLSSLIMYFNNYIIKQKKIMGFLICNKNKINFYKIFFWKTLKNKKIKIESKLNYNNSEKMYFNSTKKIISSNPIFYLDR